MYKARVIWWSFGFQGKHQDNWAVVWNILKKIHPENWGNDPNLLIFFRWVGSTTNQFWMMINLNIWVVLIVTSKWATMSIFPTKWWNHQPDKDIFNLRSMKTPGDVTRSGSELIIGSIRLVNQTHVNLYRRCILQPKLWKKPIKLGKSHKKHFIQKFLGDFLGEIQGPGIQRQVHSTKIPCFFGKFRDRSGIAPFLVEKTRINRSNEPRTQRWWFHGSCPEGGQKLWIVDVLLVGDVYSTGAMKKRGPSCLGYTGDHTTQLNRDYNEPC